MSAMVLADPGDGVRVQVIWDAERVTVKTSRTGSRTQPGDLTIPLLVCRGNSTAMEASLRSQEYVSGVRGNYGPMRVVEVIEDEPTSSDLCSGFTEAVNAYLCIDIGAVEKLDRFLEGRELPPGVRLQSGMEGRVVVFDAGPTIAFPRSGLPGGGSVVVGSSAFAFALAITSKGIGELLMERKYDQPLQIQKSHARSYLFLLGDVETEVARAFGLQDGMQDLGNAHRVTEALLF